MIDLKEYIDSLISGSDKSSLQQIVAFLNDNRWFGSRPILSEGKVYVTEKQIDLYTPLILRFLKQSDSVSLDCMLQEKFPQTAAFFSKFCKEVSVDEKTIFYVSAFLFATLEKELFLYCNADIEALLVTATNDMTKANGDTLTFFLAWMRQKTKTKYYKDYMMDKRYTMDIQNEAYRFDEYLELVYKLFNDDYISDNEMFVKAAESINYTDTWLYLSMHCICALRLTDLERIPHPDLPYTPESIIDRIREDTWELKDSLYILNSITDYLCWLPLTPNKTSAHSNIDHIKLQFPSSTENHFGKLFALAEAHRLINGTENNPIIRKVNTYQQISKYMGEDIGDLFIERNFGSRSATKSYLQAVYMVGNESEDADSAILGAKGYLLASLARSHKGDYGEFAATTFEYLKDAKFNGLTPEFVAFELLERGVLSFITAELLDMATDGKYAKLSVKNQTALIKSSGLSAKETESIVQSVSLAKKQAKNCVSTLINGEDDILTILHRIGSGQAFSKEAGTMCILSSQQKTCPFPERRQCVGCEYEILTKSTLLHIVQEYKRMRYICQCVTNKQELEKYRYIVKEILLPKLAEALQCIKTFYGEEVFTQYNTYIKEALNG